MRGRGAPAKKDKIYQSDISRTPEGIKMRFTSDTKDSKFADSGGYVFVETEEGTDAMFVLENEDIRARVDEIPQKKWVVVKGEGKGDGAWVIIEDDGGPVIPDTPKSRSQASTGSSDWMSVAADAADVAAFVYSRMEEHKHPLDSAGKASVFSTIFIAMDRRG